MPSPSRSRTERGSLTKRFPSLKRLCRNDETATHVILNEVKNLMIQYFRQHRFLAKASE
jgi:hypothetical protein